MRVQGEKWEMLAFSSSYFYYNNYIVWTSNKIIFSPTFPKFFSTPQKTMKNPNMCQVLVSISLRKILSSCPSQTSIHPYSRILLLPLFCTFRSHLHYLLITFVRSGSLIRYCVEPLRFSYFGAFWVWVLRIEIMPFRVYRTVAIILGRSDFLHIVKCLHSNVSCRFFV